MTHETSHWAKPGFVRPTAVRWGTGMCGVSFSRDALSVVASEFTFVLSYLSFSRSISSFVFVLTVGAQALFQ